MCLLPLILAVITYVLRFESHSTCSYMYLLFPAWVPVCFVNHRSANAQRRHWGWHAGVVVWLLALHAVFMGLAAEFCSEHMKYIVLIAYLGGFAALS